jgi:hypothetical protein
MPADDLVTMTESEYAAYLRDERDERELTWLNDGLPTLFKMMDPLTAAASDARVHALGFQTIDEIPF